MTKTPVFKIAQRQIGLDSPVYLIAEMGINHNGDLNLMKKMIHAAKETGVDAVKFQIINAACSYTKTSESYRIFKSVELSRCQWEEIISFARELKVDPFATFVNAEDINEFSDFDFPVYKISSTNITNFPLLKTVAQQKKPVILSTGLSHLDEVKEAVCFLAKKGVKELAILQCVALYPTPVEKANLNVIRTLMKEFPKYPIGLSDHTQGNDCAIAAVALGARLIEKHFTLDRQLPGPDQFFSATPEEMKKMVDSVRSVEKALGSFCKEPVAEEEEKRDTWRRSLVARREIKAGSVLTQDLVRVKRSSQKGLEPRYYELILGKRLLKDLLIDEPISFEVLQK